MENIENESKETTYKGILNKDIISVVGNPWNLPTAPGIGDIKHTKGKTILVIRMLDIAKLYALNNKVVYISDDNDKISEFYQTINNIKYGCDDEAIPCIDDDWKNFDNFIKELNMKFDVIIGNPPYAGEGIPLYLKVLKTCLEHTDECVWLCPAQWVKSHFNKKGTLEIKNELGDKLVSYKHIKPPFENAKLANDVGIYHFNNNVKSTIDINEIFWDRFTNKELAKSIESKFKNYNDNVAKHSDRTNKDVLPGFWCNVGHIRGSITTNGIVWDWTTLFSEFNRNNFNYRVATQSNHIQFNTENECRNFIKYTESDIIGFSIFITKNNNTTTTPMLEMIPYLGDYTKEWTDKEIAKEIGLTNKELKYIYEEMKDFGWKCAKRG